MSFLLSAHKFVGLPQNHKWSSGLESVISERTHVIQYNHMIN